MKNNTTEELEERFMRFGVDVIKAINLMKNVPKSVADQTIRASTSIGANYTEAQNASSKADFKNKIYIAKKEAAESKYWLNLIKELTNSETITILQKEVQEIILILQKIINTSRHPT
ncbi:four helix bundle protein [Candidatus Saccharibacteria bacterium SW_7_54_9]|nr:MAG: four helix bundle protein [Candidatus Saccharibacteria bacterium SW_7_54_9]